MATKKSSGLASAVSEVAFHARALKMPRIPQAAETFAARADENGWDHLTFLAAVLAEETGARETRGGAARVKAARFPQVKTFDDFDFIFQRSIDRKQIQHLAELSFLHEARNVIFLGLPGTGKTHLPPPSGPHDAATGSRSQPRTTGSRNSPPRTATANSTKNSHGSDASHCSSSTRSATSRSIPTPPHSSSHSSRRATNALR